MAPFPSLRSFARPSIKTWQATRAPIRAVLSVTVQIPVTFQLARYLLFVKIRATRFVPASRVIAARHASLLPHAQIQLITRANAPISTTLQPAGSSPYATTLQTLRASALTHTTMQPATSIHLAELITKITASATISGTSPPARSRTAMTLTTSRVSALVMTLQIPQRATTASIRQHAQTATMTTSASATISTIFRPAVL